LRLVTRNYRSRFGEIDLIMQEGAILVFVEVRKRGSKNFGGAAASIDTRKQTKIVSTAQHYLSTLKRIPPCRFDVVLISTGNELEWLKNAFDA